MMTITNNLDPDQARFTSGWIWFLTVWRSEGIPEGYFEISWFWKKKQQTKKHAKLPCTREDILVTFQPSVCWVIVVRCFFFWITFKISFMITIKGPNVSDPNQARRRGGSELDTNCLQLLSADDKSSQRGQRIKSISWIYGDNTKKSIFLTYL